MKLSTRRRYLSENCRSQIEAKLFTTYCVSLCLFVSFLDGLTKSTDSIPTIIVNLGDDMPSVFLDESLTEQSKRGERETGNSITSHWPPWARHTKMVILVACWMLCCLVLMAKNERVQNAHQISIPATATRGMFQLCTILNIILVTKNLIIKKN